MAFSGGGSRRTKKARRLRASQLSVDEFTHGGSGHASARDLAYAKRVRRAIETAKSLDITKGSDQFHYISEPCKAFRRAVDDGMGATGSIESGRLRDAAFRALSKQIRRGEKSKCLASSYYKE